MTEKSGRMGYYKDLREYLVFLEEHGKLVRIKRNIVKETELSAIARLPFRGLPEQDRMGFLFENVIDVKGHKYDAEVAAGIYASSLDMYAMGMMCEPSQIRERWTKAQTEPILPRMVSSGPVQEIVYQGEDLLIDGQGVEALPIPVELPGFSGQIRTSTQMISKDMDTNIRNCGNYSAHVFGKTKILWEIQRVNHGFYHWKSAKEKGKPLPVAFVIGATPNLTYVASAKLPVGVDEFDVAGGIAGEPMELVKCKTVDIEVPANAEAVIEGLVSTEYWEPGNAFGEYTGYMALEVHYRPVVNVTCVTTRKRPIFTHVVSQMPPSESSMLRRVSSDSIFYNFIKNHCNVPGIIDVAWHEISQAMWCVISLKKLHPAHSMQALMGAATYDPRWGKVFIAVDDDIDPRDMDSVIWAIGWRMQPHRDVKIIRGRVPGLDLSVFKEGYTEADKAYPDGEGSSAMLMDATRKSEYPPVSLPKKEFMDKALQIWEEEKLPALKLKVPWFGYDLGAWPEVSKEDAELVLKGEHYKVGQRLEKERKPV